MKSSIDLLSSLVEAVERAGANIAPTYHEYMPMAFGIANSCGEQGRALFHRLCAPSPRYVQKEADRLFDNALKDGRNSNSLGTVWHLAERAGVDMREVGQLDTGTGNPHTHTSARTLYLPASTQDPSSAPADEEPLEFADKELDIPAPLPEYEWPEFVMRCIRCGTNRPQQDVLLLSTLTTLGATLSDLLCFFYGNRRLHPCLQVFLIAPPASGKGVMGWARHLAQPIHDEKMKEYERACAVYRSEKQKWDALGKERNNQPEPERPKRKLFFISGDNTGTGIQENLIDQDGIGMISESEASILSAAISSDYGNWSHTLRKAFDHDGISYNRRTNYEHRECNRLLMTVLISGTQGQLRPLIPSAENGLFSRQLFYHMPPIVEWVSQFHTNPCDYNALFESWGERWKWVVDALRQQVSRIVFSLNAEQEAEFDNRLAQLFRHGDALYGSAMRSTVARIAINLLRLMSVVAMLRALDSLLMTDDGDELKSRLERIVPTLLECPGISPQADTAEENVRDGVVSTFALQLSPADFKAVMALAEPFYRHSAYALSQLPEEQTVQREPSKSERFLATLPMTFTRQQAMECAVKAGLSDRSCDKYIQRLLGRGTLEREGRDRYRFNPQYKATV